MLFKFIHVVGNGKTSFFFMPEWVSHPLYLFICWWTLLSFEHDRCALSLETFPWLVPFIWMLFHTHFFANLLIFLKSLPKGLFLNDPTNVGLKIASPSLKIAVLTLGSPWYAAILRLFYHLWTYYIILIYIIFIMYCLSLTCCHIDSEGGWDIGLYYFPWVLKQFLLYCIYSINILLYSSINLLFESYITEG